MTMPTLAERCLARPGWVLLQTTSAPQGPELHPLPPGLPRAPREPSGPQCHLGSRSQGKKTGRMSPWGREGTQTEHWLPHTLGVRPGKVPRSRLPSFSRNTTPLSSAASCQKEGPSGTRRAELRSSHCHRVTCGGRQVPSPGKSPGKQTRFLPVN